MDCLTVLAQLAIMVNAGIIYFTSKTYRKLFTKGPDQVSDFVSDWSLLEFLIMMIIIEHILLVVMIFVEQAIPDVPEQVIQGQTERAQLLNNFHKYKDQPSNQLYTVETEPQFDVRLDTPGDQSAIRENRAQLNKNLANDPTNPPSTAPKEFNDN